MGNFLTKVESRDEDRLLQEVGKLFALEPPAATMKSSHSPRRPSMHLQTRGTTLLDDVLSKSTDSTKGSPDLSIHGRKSLDNQLPSSSASRRGQLSSEGTMSRCSKSSFSRLFRRKPEEEQSKSSLPSCVIVQQQLEAETNQNRHPTTTSSSIPVKSSSSSRLQSLADAQESEHLQQFYDLRTWDMYLRITEARKKQPPPPPRTTNNYQVPHVSGDGADAIPENDFGWYDDASTATNTSRGGGSPHFPHNSELATTADTSQELIFGDLEF